MIRNLIHLLAVLCLLVGLAGAALWLRGNDAGDHIGWKRHQADGRDWVQEEMSARSYAGRLVFLSSRKTTGPSGPGPVRAQIRNPEEGYFWKSVVEKTPGGAKSLDEKSPIDIKRTTPAPTTAPVAGPTAAPTTAPTTAPAADAGAGQEKPFKWIDENTPTTRVRGVSVAHWLFVAVMAGVPTLWLGLTALRRGNGGGRGDRVPVVARLFSTVASISILLAFGMGLMWAKSWYVGDRVSWRDPNRPQFVEVHSGKGEFVLHFRKVDEKLARAATDLAGVANGFNWRQDADASVGYTTKSFCFEQENRVTGDGANRSLTVAAPYWFLMILALVLPSWWLRNQKHGPIKVSSFGDPVVGKAKGKLLHGYSSSQRPI